MTFTLIETANKLLKAIWLETDELSFCVGEISKERGKWKFHYCPGARHLKPSAETKMMKFVEAQITVITVKERLTQ